MELTRRRRRRTVLGADAAALTVRMAEVLRGTYSDESVETLATEDGGAQVFTTAWGTGNRASRAVDAINRGAEVSASLVSHELQGALAPLEENLERLGALGAGAEHDVLRAIDDVEAAEVDRERIAHACRAGDLGLPDHARVRELGEGAVFTGLGTGDLYLSTQTYEVFGLSDRRFGFLPFNELQVAAGATVLALLVLAWLAGHQLRGVGYLLEAHRPGLDDASRRRVRVRQWFMAGGSLVALGGVLGLLFGLSQVRASYLAQSGMDAHASQFLLIQLGIATAGVVVSLWMSHPYDRQWRSATRHAARAAKALAGAYSVFAGLVGEFNGLLRFRVAVMNQHCDWAVATVVDAARKGQMYARRVLLAQPEPTTDPLLPDTLPVPASPPLVAAVAEHRAGGGVMFKLYEPTSLARVEARLADLDRRRAERVAALWPQPPASAPSPKRPGRTGAK